MDVLSWCEHALHCVLSKLRTITPATAVPSFSSATTKYASCLMKMTYDSRLITPLPFMPSRSLLRIGPKTANRTAFKPSTAMLFTISTDVIRSCKGTYDFASEYQSWRAFTSISPDCIALIAWTTTRAAEIVVTQATPRATASARIFRSSS